MSKISRYLKICWSKIAIHKITLYLNHRKARRPKSISVQSGDKKSSFVATPVWWSPPPLFLFFVEIYFFLILTKIELIQSFNSQSCGVRSFYAGGESLRSFSLKLPYYDIFLNFWPIMTFNRYRRELETCPQPNWPKVDASIFFFFPMRPSDEYDSAPSQKLSRPLLDVFACGQVSSPRLYRFIEILYKKLR